MSFSKTVLPNGIRVVTEYHPYARAVSTGIFLDTGTRDESEKEAGISHFLEHMVFKGTNKRSAYRIARELEAVGGDLNAYTTQEYTCYHATSLKDDFKLQIDVLCDLVKNAKFSEIELKREKGVVLQEIAMAVDHPEEHIFDIFFDEIYGTNRLGRPILGTEKTVSNFTQKDIRKFYESRYAPKNIIVSCTGGVEHEKVVQLVSKQLGDLKRRFQPRKRVRPSFHPIRKVVSREIEQVQIVVGIPAASYCDDFRFDAFILNSLLGGGMTSKLYQAIREKRGLAYTVYSQLTTFTDVGVMSVYAATDSKQWKTVLELIFKEFKELRKRKISESDLKLFKHQVRGAILLGADDMENRMNSLGINEMVFSDYRAIEKVIEDLESVTTKSLREYIMKFLDLHETGILIMGNVDQKSSLKFIESLK